MQLLKTGGSQPPVAASHPSFYTRINGSYPIKTDKNGEGGVNDFQNNKLSKKS